MLLLQSKPLSSICSKQCLPAISRFVPHSSSEKKRSGFNLILQPQGTQQLHANNRRQPNFSSREHKACVLQASAPIIMAAANPKVLIPVGNGTEEMEAVIMIDVLRRAGADVTVASVEACLHVTCSRGVKLTADAFIADAAKDQYDLIAMPGGMPGAERLRDCAALEGLVKAQKEDGRLLAAICATPAVFLEAKGMLAGQKATCHPGFSAQLSNQSAVESRVVVDGKLTTSRGPGTAFEFALSLVNQLYGKEKMESVAGPIVMYPYSV